MTAKKISVLGTRRRDGDEVGMSSHHQHHHDGSSSSSSPSPSSGTTASLGLAPGFEGGPMFCNPGINQAFMGDIYDVVGAAVPDPYFAFSSSGEMGGPVNGRSVPLFTADQWQELEKQTLIYKYMMASLPVPPQLFVSLTKCPSNSPPYSTTAVRSSLELGIASNRSDPEPWRCRRTDGKKWRCSRDVAPDQKYCERHSHKNRPRSRKPVEYSALHLNKSKMKNDHDKNSDHVLVSQPIKYQIPTVFPTLLSATASSYDQPRCLEWFVNGETVSVASNSTQDWQELVQPRIRLRREYTICGQNYRDRNLNLQAQAQLPECRLRSGSGSGSGSGSMEEALNLNQTQTQETKHLVDGWSKAVAEQKDVINTDVPSKNRLLPLSCLTLSMYSSVGRETSQEPKKGEMGRAKREQLGGEDMSHDSWMGSPPGGPLAEVLCLGFGSSLKGSSTTSSSCSSKSSHSPWI